MTILDFQNLKQQLAQVNSVTDFTVEEVPNQMGGHAQLAFDTDKIFVSVLKEAIMNFRPQLINQTKKIMAKRVEVERAAMVKELRDVLAVEEPIVLAAKSVL